MAYNEEANIANAVEGILSQRLRLGEIAEVIVVASGCTDRTVDIVAGLANENQRVRLIVQERREGKASAINLFIAAARYPVLLMVSADVLVKEGAADVLLQHFADPQVGMVGGHPIPVNDENTFLGHAVHLLWRLHDQIARTAPKLGEIVAFRNVVPSIPFDTPVDEISIQALVTQLGYALVYEPRAIVYNRGPTTVRDFLRQRRRIYAGHLRIRKQQRYAASTMSVRRVARVLLSSRAFGTPLEALWTVGAVLLEALARALGYYDSLRQQPHHIWEMVATTKLQIAEAAGARADQTILVFHIPDFHHHTLELGIRGSRLLARRVLRHIEETFGGTAAISGQQATVVAILDGIRDEAEARAQALIAEIGGTPFAIGGERVVVNLACGIIAFSGMGEPVARSIPDSHIGTALPTASSARELVHV